MAKKTWHRVKAPKPWLPKDGQELIGTYITTEMRSGQFGDYRVHFIKTRTEIQYVSGAMVNDLFALVDFQTIVKLVFLGKKLSKENREYKCFELYSEEEITLKIAEIA